MVHRGYGRREDESTMMFPAGQSVHRTSTCPSCPNSKCLSVFADLDQDTWRELQGHMNRLRYETGDVLYREKTPIFGVYIVCSGQVKLTQRDAKHRLILKIVGPSGALGEEDMFEDVYSATAEALEPTQVMFLPREQFLAFMQACPELLLKLAARLSVQVKGFQAKVMEAAYEEVEERMARILLSLTNRYGSNNGSGTELQLKLSRADLAELAGISTETAIRTLRQFTDRGLIELNRRQIIVKDRDALEELVEPLMSEMDETLY